MKPWTFLCLIVLAAPAYAVPATSPDPRHGWKCNVSMDMITIYQWLKAPKAEPGIRYAGDTNPVYLSSDPAFKYVALPKSQYLSFTVQPGRNFKLLDEKAGIISFSGLTVEIAGGGKTVASKIAGPRASDVAFFHADAVAIASLFTNPSITSLEIRLKSGAGKLLVSHNLPIAGFMEAGKAGGAALPSAPSGMGTAC